MDIPKNNLGRLTIDCWVNSKETELIVVVQVNENMLCKNIISLKKSSNLKHRGGLNNYRGFGKNFKS